MSCISASPIELTMTAQTGLLHYEDFDVGMIIDLGSYPVTAEEIVSFAQ